MIFAAEQHLAGRPHFVHGESAFISPHEGKGGVRARLIPHVDGVFELGYFVVDQGLNESDLFDFLFAATAVRESFQFAREIGDGFFIGGHDTCGCRSGDSRAALFRHP